MTEWDVTENDIQRTESVLLPRGCNFADDAKAVIRCWESKDVSACPGSGKTTVLLAKLKLLADKMPLNNGAGVCVLSHTNVAVNEIKSRLSDCADKLMAYPNYIGTIQSFIDQFVTMPYIRQKYGRTVQPVDDEIYAEHLLQVINSGQSSQLRCLVDNQYSANNAIYKNKVAFVKALSLDDAGNLRLQNQRRPLAGSTTKSAEQFAAAQQTVLFTNGLIRYGDTYPLACEAISSLSDEYTNLFSERFKYVFIDEYQDCSDDQREALSRLFDSAKCRVMRIGDPDQAIYSFQEDNMVDWIPDDGCLSIESSCRYPQEIADILIPLRKGGTSIVSTNGSCGYKPVLIVFNDRSIDSVLSQFVVQLEAKGLHDPNGEYYAIGFVGKESVTGLRIGSYWNKYKTALNSKNDYRYWMIIEEVCESLRNGKLYRAENSVRKLICRMFHYSGVTNKDTSKEFTQTSIKDRLKQEYYDYYTDHIIALSELHDISKDAVDGIVRSMMDALLKGKGQTFFDALPAWFLDPSASSKTSTPDNNILVDPIRGRKIRLCTIHAVKGQTHDATLFLETEKNRGSDLARILWCYGIGKPGQSSLFEYSRKLAYVGFSRPKKLLCVAIQESTYEKCKKQFHNKLWEVVDVRQ